jgi:hypothetical protein
MPQQERACTLVKRVAGSESSWTYIFAKPNVIGSSLAPGAMARPTYYYIRSFQNEFLCECGGKSATVYVANNFEIGTIEEPNLQVFPVATISISIPGVGGLLGEVAIEAAQRIFGSLSTAIGWLDPAAVKARGESLLGNPTVVEMKAENPPIAVCGDHIRMATGVEEEWPPAGESVPPPSPEEEAAWRALSRMRQMNDELMSFLKRWLKTIIEMLQSRDGKVRERGRHQLETLLEILNRLLRILHDSSESAEETQEGANQAGSGH